MNLRYDIDFPLSENSDDCRFADLKILSLTIIPPRNLVDHQKYFDLPSDDTFDSFVTVWDFGRSLAYLGRFFGL